MGNEDIEKTPDRRAGVRVSNVIKPHEQIKSLIKLIAGIVGVKAALALEKYLRVSGSIPAEELLLAFDSVKAKIDKMSLQEIIDLNEQIAQYINGNIGKIKGNNKQTIQNNLKQYIQTLGEKKHKEAISESIEQVHSKRYPNFTSFITNNAVAVHDLLTEYIEGVMV